jgi:AcrR family transcriptional regulator
MSAIIRYMSESSGKAAPSIRARVRAEMVDEIKRVARERLAEEGAALSLRAVARDMGMVSSALYRYFPSRDDLLTTLILDAYNSMGEASERGDATVRDRRDLFGRFLATGHAIRDWAVERPHEYALVYGSPVPRYKAPTDTIEPSTRPYAVFAMILADGMAAATARGDGGSGDAGAGAADSGDAVAEAAAGPAFADPPLTDRLAGELHQASMGLNVGPSEGMTGAPPPSGDTPMGPPPVLIARTFAVFTQLFGAISFELFGRLNNVISDRREWYDWQLRSMAAYLGLSPLK